MAELMAQAAATVANGDGSDEEESNEEGMGDIDLNENNVADDDDDDEEEEKKE